mmetsp:Transcript_17151/g.37431  ORF Transcript_17151/g.37431 Transcript_17151/m.37431 type:complete len:145 (-) Transcript_17151:1805-2239(-)
MSKSVKAQFKDGSQPCFVAGMPLNESHTLNMEILPVCSNTRLMKDNKVIISAVPFKGRRRRVSGKHMSNGNVLVLLNELGRRGRGYNLGLFNANSARTELGHTDIRLLLKYSIDTTRSSGGNGATFLAQLTKSKLLDDLGHDGT